MRLSDLRRFTPVHWIMGGVAVLCLIVAAVLVLQDLGFRFDPFRTAERRAARAEAVAATARADAAARGFEVDGARATVRMVQQGADIQAAADRIATRYATEARATADAPLPPDPDRSRRIRDADRGLCDLRPASCAARAAAP